MQIACYHTRFRFLNQPASLVSLGIDTERDTLEGLLEFESSG